MESESASSMPREIRTSGRVSVLIPLALFTAYDYAVSEGLTLEAGDFVSVQLGRRTVKGVVWGAGDDSVPAEKLRAVAARLEIPAIPEVSRRFIDWGANYCMAPIGSVLRMAMSVPEALEPEKPIKAWQIGNPDSGKMPDARQRVLAALAEGPPLTTGDLARAASSSPGVVAEMARSGMLQAVALPARRPFGRPDADRAGPKLSAAQQEAVDALRPLTPGVTLLH